MIAKYTSIPLMLLMLSMTPPPKSSFWPEYTLSTLITSHVYDVNDVDRSRLAPFAQIHILASHTSHVHDVTDVYRWEGLAG